MLLRLPAAVRTLGVSGSVFVASCTFAWSAQLSDPVVSQTKEPQVLAGVVPLLDDQPVREEREEQKVFSLWSGEVSPVSDKPQLDPRVRPKG